MEAGGTVRGLEAGFSEVSGPPQSCDTVGAAGSAPGLGASRKIGKHSRCCVAREPAGPRVKKNLEAKLGPRELTYE